MQKNSREPITISAVVILCLTLAGCNTAFHDLGTPPTITEVGYDAPLEQILIPDEPEIIKAPERLAMEDNGIWNQKDSIYFRDTRAFEVGDILTVDISINDKAKFDNSSERNTELEGNVGANTDLTLGSQGTLPAVSIAGGVTGDLDVVRKGTVNRTEQIQLQIAAVVTEASSNGNLRIIGSQEVRVNHEIRILKVEGVVRTRDILADNTIPYDKIAEARISYGGHNSRRIAKPRKPWNLFHRRKVSYLTDGY
ncbi:MAG: flagellar basal body L-ring protein FlgH [Pseudomonadota bacterium]